MAAPFYQVAAFQGALTNVDSSNQMSFTGANFGNLTTAPHLARFKTGNSTGALSTDHCQHGDANDS